MNKRHLSNSAHPIEPNPKIAKHNVITLSDPLLTAEQVASMIGKSQAWLARKRWEGGGIPYRKIGRHVRYQSTVVLDWLNEHPTFTSTSQEKN